MEQTFQILWLLMVVTIAIVWFFLVWRVKPVASAHCCVQFHLGQRSSHWFGLDILPNKSCSHAAPWLYHVISVYLGHLFAVTELCSLNSDFVFGLSSCNIIFWGGVQLFFKTEFHSAGAAKLTETPKYRKDNEDKANTSTVVVRSHVLPLSFWLLPLNSGSPAFIELWPPAPNGNLSSFLGRLPASHPAPAFLKETRHQILTQIME